MQVGYRHTSRFWSNSWLSKIAGHAKCQKHLPTTKLSIWPVGHSRPRTTGYRSIAGRANYEVTKTVIPTTMQCRSHSRRRTSECLFVTACSMDEYGEEKRTEKNLIVRSGKSEAETTNNKRLRSIFLYWSYTDIRSITRPLCHSRASCLSYRSSWKTHCGSRISAFDWYQFRWPWLTSNNLYSFFLELDV